MIDGNTNKSVKVRKELRGYKLQSLPPDRATLSVSQLAKTICSTHRDIYFEKILRVRVNPQDRPYQSEVGTMIHELLQMLHKFGMNYVHVHAADFNAQNMLSRLRAHGTQNKKRLMQRYRHDPRFSREIWEGVDRQLSAIIFFESLLTCSLLAFKASRKTAILSTGQRIELMQEFDQLFDFSAIEHQLSAPQLGMTDPVTPDFLYNRRVIGDIKTGSVHEDTFQMTCVAYALAYEAEYRRNIDYGVILHVGQHADYRYPIYHSSKIYKIDDSARIKFILLRDQKLDVLANRTDPGRQPDEPRCRPCPFYQRCWQIQENA
jgi:CRISPR/Cas system-associated exonuclease Cas4 (RecB family)